jgi:hypothetical protein
MLCSLGSHRHLFKQFALLCPPLPPNIWNSNHKLDASPNAETNAGYNTIEPYAMLYSTTRASRAYISSPLIM